MMQKALNFLLVTLITVFLFLLLPTLNIFLLKADCTDWQCDTVIRNGGEFQTCTCKGQSDETGGACDGTCGPGTYVCNNGNPGQCSWTCCDEGTNPGGPCFPAGTKVTLSDSSTRNIENVQAGDKVLSQDETGRQSVSTVQNSISPVSNNMCEIRYTDGESLKVTKGHPLFTQSGWKATDPVEALKEDPGVPVARLMVGDLMTKADRTWP